MKVVVKTVEVDKEGLSALLDQVVTLFCGVYIYTGKLVGINDTCVKLEDASLVFETGPFSSKEWKLAEKLGPTWYVSTGAIESFGKLK